MVGAGGVEPLVLDRRSYFWTTVLQTAERTSALEDWWIRRALLPLPPACKAGALLIELRTRWWTQAVLPRRLPIANRLLSWLSYGPWSDLTFSGLQRTTA